MMEKYLENAKRKRKWVVALGALGFTCYGAYRVYTLPCVVKKRQRLFKLFTALFSLAEMVSDSSYAIGILSKDLKEFIGSDSDQVPQSFKQLSKLARSDEFSESLTRITRAMAVGVLQSYQHETTKGDNGVPDRVFNKIFSDAGSGFASAVVGSFARSLVMALYSAWQQDNLKSDQTGPRWVEVAREDKCREVIGGFVQLFVSTAVTVYLDKTMNINTYDDFFSGLTNPKHEVRVRNMLVSLCNGGVETCLQTSYNVWSKNSKSNSMIEFDQKNIVPRKKLREKNQESGLMRKRKLVLDMTAVVTFETVRSSLEFLHEKLSEGVKRSIGVVHQEVIDKGAETMRYASGKSSAATNLCLTLCLNILNSPWMLAPPDFHPF